MGKTISEILKIKECQCVLPILKKYKEEFNKLKWVKEERSGILVIEDDLKYCEIGAELVASLKILIHDDDCIFYQRLLRKHNTAYNNHRKVKELDFIEDLLSEAHKAIKVRRTRFISGAHNTAMVLVYYTSWIFLKGNIEMLEKVKLELTKECPKSTNKINSPTIALFCKLISESGYIPIHNTTNSAYCVRVCAEFNLKYTDNVRQNFSNKLTSKNLVKVVELILPKINKNKYADVISYITSKYENQQKLYA